MPLLFENSLALQFIRTHVIKVLLVSIRLVFIRLRLKVPDNERIIIAKERNDCGVRMTMMAAPLLSVCRKHAYTYVFINNF